MDAPSVSGSGLFKRYTKNAPGVHEWVRGVLQGEACCSQPVNKRQIKKGSWDVKTQEPSPFVARQGGLIPGSVLYLHIFQAQPDSNPSSASFWWEFWGNVPEIRSFSPWTMERLLCVFLGKHRGQSKMLTLACQFSTSARKERPRLETTDARDQADMPEPGGHLPNRYGIGAGEP
jgi:hypothetical protein